MAIKKNDASIELLVEKPKLRKRFTPEELELRRQRDLEEITGIFRNYEQRGGLKQFICSFHKNDKPLIYTLIDGGTYTLPRCVAEHIENDVAYKIYENINKLGLRNLSTGLEANYKVKSTVHITGFQPIDMKDVRRPDYKEVVLVERA